MQIIIDYIRENKKKVLLTLILIIVLTIISLLINSKNTNKIFVSESYVYTKESYSYSERLISELPYINIKSESVDEINKKLLEKYYEIITLDEQIMVYRYYINDDILSLIVKTYYKDSPDSYPTETYFYNISINSGNLITNRDLLNEFNVSVDDVTNAIRNKIKEYYNYEIINEYINNDCDFDCYLSETNSLPIIEDGNYYVKDDQLFAYKIINVDSKFFYDFNSGFNLFNFKIK